MSFSTGCANNLVPLLSRLVLAGAFVTVGWHKIRGQQQFTGEQAQVLIDLGVVEPPAASATPVSLGSPGSGAAPPVEPAQPTEPAPGPEAEPEEDSPAEKIKRAAEEAAEEIEKAIEDLELPEDVLVSDDPATGPVVLAKPLHTVTVLLVNKTEWDRYAAWLAWLNALTELFAGALILIGLFSRLWGLALAAVMAVAFYFTSVPVLAEVGWDPFAVPAMQDGFVAFNRMYCQLGLFVLAFGVFLTGAGAVSIDRLLFRRSVVEEEIVITEPQRP